MALLTVPYVTIIWGPISKRVAVYLKVDMSYNSPIEIQQWISHKSVRNGLVKWLTHDECIRGVPLVSNTSYSCFSLPSYQGV